jgi:thiamine kinase-like enzyme
MISTDPLPRLQSALNDAGFGQDVKVVMGTQGVASPTRLATEWAGYRVTDGADAYYAKVLHADMAELINVEQSAEASKCAAASGSAPGLRWVDVASGVLIFEDLPSPGWRGARLDELLVPGRLQALWALKKQLHAGPDPGFVRSPMADIQKLNALRDRDDVAAVQDHDWIDQCVAMAWQALQTRPALSVPVHGDGLACNVMVSAQGHLQLIDFDYGGCMDPWYDVATTLNELYPFESQWRKGIAAWAGQCSEFDYAVCRLYALISDWYWTLWGQWSGATSSRQLEFSKVGQWTLLRCRQTVRDPRFEGWLRHVEGGAA